MSDEQGDLAGLPPPRTMGVYAIRGIPGWIKIGRAFNIAQRIDDLQSASPVPLVLLAVLSTDIRHELIFHRHLAHLRGLGEWFREDIELTLFVRERRRNPTGCPHAALRLATRTAASDPARRSAAREPTGPTNLAEIADRIREERRAALKRFTAGFAATAGATSTTAFGGIE